jgi:hypothetical protein
MLITFTNLEFARESGLFFIEIPAFGGIVGHTQRKAMTASARNAVQDAEKYL